MHEVFISGQAYRYMRDNTTPREDVQEALEGATSLRRGRGTIHGIRASEETLLELAAHLDSIVEVNAVMTTAERGGERTHYLAEAAERIRRALH